MLMRQVNSPLYARCLKAARLSTITLSSHFKVSCVCRNRVLIHTHQSPISPLHDERSRLSKLWAPSGGIAPSQDEDGYMKLVRAGFLRQAHAGIFHMLPLGRRVQDKIERLIDKHMSKLGASKMDMSSISSEDLWTKSGRLSGVNSELFRFKDRKDGKYLLSPTHEEEITCVVANSVKSYKQLPARLYQISRKYRDELRPRHGLLRSREFVMKDLYTFDYNEPFALATYNQVREVYTALFDELKISYLVAEADSGNMGGNLSHEYHFPTLKGEDHIISCDRCDYVANEELARSTVLQDHQLVGQDKWSYTSPGRQTSSSQKVFSVWRGISQDRSKLINVWYPASPNGEINIHAVKRIIPDLDSGVKNAARLWIDLAEQGFPVNRDASKGLMVINLVDCRLPQSIVDCLSSNDNTLPVLPSLAPSSIDTDMFTVTTLPSDDDALNLMRITPGDPCARCSEGRLKVQRAIELGHTFFLGTRYSDPLRAMVDAPVSPLMVDVEDEGPSVAVTGSSSPVSQVPMQMGCHGIGVSRMIGTIAEILADNKGLNWPRVIAPYDAVVVSSRGLESHAITVYDTLARHENGGCGKACPGVDVILDDRNDSFAWKMRDADLVGYPVIVVIGRGWKLDRTCEVQCRRLGIIESVPLEDLYTFVDEILQQL